MPVAEQSGALSRYAFNYREQGDVTSHAVLDTTIEKDNLLQNRLIGNGNLG